VALFKGNSSQSSAGVPARSTSPRAASSIDFLAGGKQGFAAAQDVFRQALRGLRGAGGLSISSTK